MKSNYSNKQIDEAVNWVLIHEGEMSEAQIIDFDEWKKQRHDNEICFFEHQLEWSNLDSMRHWSPQISDNPNPDLFVNDGSALLKYCIPLVSIAACVLVFFNVFIKSQKPNIWQETVVESYEGGKKHFLSDGSSFYLKVGSDIHVSYSTEVRYVFLKKGEAIFDVAHESNRPFIVSTERTEVVAIGTVFSVNSNENFCEVYVTEGKVKLNEKGTNEDCLESHVNLILELSAGQKASVPVATFNPQFEVEFFSPQEYAKKMFWKNQIIDMVSAPLYEIIDEFNKHNETQIYIQDENLREIRMSVSVKPGNQEEFLRLLEMTLNVRLSFTSSGVYLFSEN